jgi:hypothetical protein
MDSNGDKVSKITSIKKDSIKSSNQSKKLEKETSLQYT